LNSAMLSSTFAPFAIRLSISLFILIPSFGQSG
jgi:hypothetical protein